MEVEGAVADRLEEDDDAVAVVALDFARSPALVGDGGADREGAYRVVGVDEAGVAVVAVPARNRVRLAEVAEDVVAAAAFGLGVGADHREAGAVELAALAALADAGLVKPDDSERPFPIGAAVTHKAWGPGEVQRYDRDRVVVLFEAVGYRTLDLHLVEEEGLLT